MSKPEEIIYEDREALDKQLSDVMADILSAEQEAKQIIAEAEEKVKAVQMEAAVCARTMREEYSRLGAEAKAKVTEDALSRAKAERERRVASAQEDGQKLIKQKDKAIAEIINKLYESLGGKA